MMMAPFAFKFIHLGEIDHYSSLEISCLFREALSYEAAAKTSIKLKSYLGFLAEYYFIMLFKDSVAIFALIVKPFLMNMLLRHHQPW